MFAFLRGIVARKTVDYVELDVGGVGYEVSVPERVQRKLATGREATLLTHCHIREDTFQIFGFLREDERTLFRMLLGVTGVGPKAALSVLSTMGVGDFGRAVHEHDVTALTKVNGVGKKTAQRIVLEIKARMGQDAELDAILGQPDEEERLEDDDVIAALCALGCTMGEAKKAASTARKQLGEGASDEELVKAALRSIAKA